MSRRTHHTVLLIDDDQDILELMAHALRRESMEVIPRRSTEEGLRVLGQQSVDCVSLDIPYSRAVEGFAFLATLRSLGGHAAVPCVVTSAMDARQVENRARALGAHEFIPKPFYPAEVATAIRTAVSPSSRTGPNSSD